MTSISGLSDTAHRGNALWATVPNTKSMRACQGLRRAGSVGRSHIAPDRVAFRLHDAVGIPDQYSVGLDGWPSQPPSGTGKCNDECPHAQHEPHDVLPDIPAMKEAQNRPDRTQFAEGFRKRGRQLVMKEAEYGDQ